MATIDSRRGADFDPLAPEEHAGLPARYGIGPGFAGGLLMMATLLILSAAQARGILRPFELIASVFLGARALGSVAAGLVGIVAHLVVSTLLGMVFARLAGRTTRRRLLFMGLLMSVASWALLQFLILPYTQPHMTVELGNVWPFFLGHLSYGLLLASLLPTIADIDARPQAYIDPLKREVHP